MTATKYAFQEYDEKTMSRAYGRGLSISTKKSVEVCNWIKGKSVSNAIKMLEEVIALKRAVPYRRFNQELAHQRNTGSGGFPVNVAKSILYLLKSAEANAVSKGLNSSSLRIEHICAHLGSRPFRHGRKRRVKAKRTHIEIVLREFAAKSQKATKTKEPAKVAKKSLDSEKTEEVKKIEDVKKPVADKKSDEQNVDAVEKTEEAKVESKKVDVEKDLKSSVDGEKDKIVSEKPKVDAQ